MKLPIYQVDAFTNNVFGGNPACVVPLKKWINDEVLIKIAEENAVPETAFFVKSKNFFHLRWFTPEIEMDLCGHATLATAFIIRNFFDYHKDEVIFKTLSGELKVTFKDKLLTLDFFFSRPIIFAEPAVSALTFSIKLFFFIKAEH